MHELEASLVSEWNHKDGFLKMAAT